MAPISQSSAKIQLHNFSSARRIFALSQVKQIAAEFGDQALVSQICQAITYDHETMHLEALWKSAVQQYQTFIEDQETLERLMALQRRELDERQSTGQQLLVQVVATILAEGTFHDMEARRELLAPIYEHNLRLHLRRDREAEMASSYREVSSHA